MGRSEEQKPFVISDELASERFIDLLNDLDADSFAGLLQYAFGGEIFANHAATGEASYTVTPDQSYSGGLDTDEPKINPFDQFKKDKDRMEFQLAKGKNNRR